MSLYSYCDSASLTWYDGCAANGNFCYSSSDNKIYCQYNPKASNLNDGCGGSSKSGLTGIACASISETQYLQSGKFIQSSLDTFISNHVRASNSDSSSSSNPTTVSATSVIPSSASSSSASSSSSGATSANSSSGRVSSANSTSISPTSSNAVKKNLSVPVLILVTLICVFPF